MITMLEKYDGMSIRQINKFYRSTDTSELWPVNGKFNATERAIRKVQKMRKHHNMVGLEYAMALEQVLCDIINDPKHT